MQVSPYIRGGQARMRRLPAGSLPLIVATIVLVAVPIARAAGDDPAAGHGGTPVGSAPIAREAARSPKIIGELVKSRSISGSAIKIRGRVYGTGRGRAHVRMSVRHAGSRKWRVVSTGNIRTGERFTLGWRGGSAGRYMTKISVRKFGKTDVDRTGRAYIFRRSFASYYGPGLYGGALACGGRLSPSTVGVAHKTLPCGTRVTFKVGSRLVTTRVIDRGPFIAGRDWDLTTGLKHKLGFGSTGAVYATR